MSGDVVSEEAVRFLGRRIGMVSAVYALIFVALAWPDTRAMGLIVGLWVARIVFNLVVATRMGMLAKGWAGVAFVAAFNTAISLCVAHVLHWHLAAIMELPLQCMTVGPVGARWRAVVLIAAILVVNGAVALADGLAPTTVSVMLVTTALLLMISEQFTGLLRTMLASKASSHEQLVLAHQRLEEMHQKLQRREQLTGLGMIAAGIAHEINNPMAFVTENLMALGDDLADLRELPPELAIYRDDILPATIDGVERVNAIVADLRRFSRVDAAAEGHAAFDLNREVAAVARMTAGQTHGRELTVHLDPDVGCILGRANQIGQVLVNLIVNAAQATPDGGHISLSTRRLGDLVVVTVADDGMGMSDETKRRLFEPFYTTKPVGQGTGLGLAAVHGIVTAHSGTIEITSTLGRGTTIAVSLPVAAPSARIQSATMSVASLRAAIAR